MASHINVTAATAMGLVSKSLNGQASADPRRGNDFEALLGSTTRSARPQPREPELATDRSDSERRDDPEAVAAPVETPAPIQSSFDAKAELTALVSSLSALKASLDAGEPIDPETLKSIDAALQRLSGQLNIDLTDAPSLDDLKAMLAGAPDSTSLEAELTKALSPLAEGLLSGKGVTNGDNADLLKSVGDKLAALLKSLNAGSPDELAALQDDAELKSALARLAAPAAKIETSPEAQPLATPELKLTERVLAGKSGDTDQPSRADDSSKPVLAAKTDSHRNDTNAGDKSDKSRQDGSPSTPRDNFDPTTTATQPNQQAVRIEAAVTPRPVVTGYQTSQQQLNLPQIAFELVRQVSEGTSRFQIRLDPAELGRIDVRMDIDKSGQVTARLTVEKAETLDLMQRDQRGLEKALQQAGLDSSKTNLEFSLKQSPFSGGQQQGQNGSPRQSLLNNRLATEADEAPAPTINHYRGSLGASGVNIIA